MVSILSRNDDNNRTMEGSISALKRILKSLSNNEFDRRKILNYLEQYKLDYDPDAKFPVLKYTLKLKIVKDLIAISTVEDLKIKRILDETRSILEYHNLKKLKNTIPCCRPGCLFECSKHRDYLRHLKRTHLEASNLKCQFSTSCNQVFATISLLLSHVSECHRKNSTLSGTTGSSAQVSSSTVFDAPCNLYEMS